MKSYSESVVSELETIRNKNLGMLRAEDVVEFARSKNTALHRKFTWDDSEAARQHRLSQARHVINVHVVIMQQTKREFRAYVSLGSDRRRDGGGYRSTEQVLSQAETRAEWIGMVLDDLKRLQQKYEALVELAGAFDAMYSAIEKAAARAKSRSVGKSKQRKRAA